ncbi:hypothetical protein BX659_1265 [Orenia metallireducens]|uniref:Uncharacterized protein n=1 Tax=Orenia metallireducens TaxID=1413210 RepID=A0A285I1Q7_9FIRM|nr:hypothetical protein [Orenia metallireducens]PRX23226.1 hypothetical protein BX659_1265 [Orenia metallireducens]SNY41888.1 hypothetical protein SAMN06265827_1295 [Orenia metallireducens]
MGWFGNIVRSVGRKVGKAVETVGEVFGSETIENAGRAIQDVCTETSRQTGRTNEYDKERARVEETKRINKILIDFSNQLKDEMDELERKSIKESMSFFDNLMNEIEKQNKKGIIKINTRRINRYRNEIEKEIKGKLKSHLAKRVSLDDSECLKILKMPSGRDKEKKMDNFSRKVIREGLSHLSEDIKGIISEQRDYLENVLNDKMDEIIKSNEKKLSEFSEVESLMNSNQKGYESKKADVQLTIDISEFAINKLEI